MWVGEWICSKDRLTRTETQRNLLWNIKNTGQMFYDRKCSRYFHLLVFLPAGAGLTTGDFELMNASWRTQPPPPTVRGLCPTGHNTFPLPLPSFPSPPSLIRPVLSSSSPSASSSSPSFINRLASQQQEQMLVGIVVFKDFPCPDRKTYDFFIRRRILSN